MEKNPINLFQSQATFSPELTLVERYLKAGRTIFLSILLGVGFVSLIGFFIIQYQKQALERERQDLYTSVTGNMTKEALLLALRARVVSLKKIMLFQVSIAPYIDTTLLIAAPPKLSSFSLGEGSSVRITVESKNIDDAISIVKTVIQLTDEKKIKNPTITSIILNKDGTITIGFMYVTVL